MHEFHHQSWPLFRTGQPLIIDLSRVTQWHSMYDKKYITAGQRYGVARFVTDTIINAEKYHVLVLYSSAHGVYIMTLPIPIAEWQLFTAPEPFNEHKILFLAHFKPQRYDMGRPISVEFLFKPQEALKRYRDLSENELFVMSSTPAFAEPD